MSSIYLHHDLMNLIYILPDYNFFFYLFIVPSHFLYIADTKVVLTRLKPY